MEGVLTQRKARRRSMRIVLRVPLLINSAEAEGETDWETVETLVVSFHGALIRTRQRFPVGAKLQIRTRDGMREAAGRVVWTRSGASGKAYELGFEILDAPGFWEIRFYPDPEPRPPKAKP